MTTKELLASSHRSQTGGVGTATSAEVFIASGKTVAFGHSYSSNSEVPFEVRVVIEKKTSSGGWVMLFEFPVYGPDLWQFDTKIVKCSGTIRAYISMTEGSDFNNCLMMTIN